MTRKPEDNGGWIHKLLMWDWHSLSLDGYPGWDLETENTPAFVKLTHVRGKGDVESTTMTRDWDDLAEVDFYTRDWTDSGIPIVCEGETYWSGWWFATIVERDRFVKWCDTRPEVKR